MQYFFEVNPAGGAAGRKEHVDRRDARRGTARKAPLLAAPPDAVRRRCGQRASMAFST